MRIIFLGLPGSGKGTQSKMLADYLGIKHISTGDILREAISSQTDTGKKAAEYAKAGLLVPDKIVNEIILEAVEKNKKNGFILDGYPRNIFQAEFLASFADTDKVFYINVSEDEIIRRLSNRMTCRDCGKIYNAENNPPKEEGACDSCSGELYVREDDKPVTIKKRIEVYQNEVQKIIDYYSNNKKLFEIDGSDSPDKVFKKIQAAL